jgi:hypothetical protein
MFYPKRVMKLAHLTVSADVTWGENMKRETQRKEKL